ncbi:carotenoid oxygenase 1 [Penicillium lividum]|nr:carotenoid oxygenase 1 [Penicillium lividum]
MAGHLLRNDLDKRFPVPKAFREEEAQMSGFMAPVRFEGSVTDLEIIGRIPETISGTFYRVMPEPHYPSFVENDPWFNGDGVVSAFKIKDGHVDFKQAYVRTEKYVKEAEARRALLGKYRNKYTDAIAFQIRSTANTNIVYWNGRLLALKEDSPPYSMDPDTLQTIGLETFDGQLPALTFTAHPKFDTETGDMVCFGYEAKGDGTPDVCYYSVGRDGKFKETVWFTCPVVAMIHDFAVTKNYVLFPVILQTCDLERMKKGGEHWQWENELPAYIGVLPRYGAKGSEVKWFEAPHGFLGHTANAFENEDGNIELTLPYYKVNAFYWWKDKDGRAPAPEQIRSDFVKFTIDPKATNLKLPEGEHLVSGEMEFPRIDDRYAMTRHSKTFYCTFQPERVDFPFVGPRMGGGYPPFNGIGFLDSDTGKVEQYFAGPRKFTQEVVFCPRSQDAPEGDGWLIFLQSNFDTMQSELAIVDTKDMSQTVALIKLPIRLRTGLHGNWVDDADVFKEA